MHLPFDRTTNERKKDHEKPSLHIVSRFHRQTGGPQRQKPGRHPHAAESLPRHKVRAENRDKLQIIKGLARQKKFDILLVFMLFRLCLLSSLVGRMSTKMI